MTNTLGGVLWRVCIFVVLCLVAMFTLFAIFSQLRFEPRQSYNADFVSASGLEVGDFVRIAGVEVGKVVAVAVKQDNTATVRFSADDAVTLTEGSRAVIRYADLIGGRYLALEGGPGGTHKLAPGQTIPISHTSPALDLDAVIGGFRPLFRALDPDQVNALTGELVTAFQGQARTFGSFFVQTANLTNALADRDQLIGQVIINLNTVLGSLGDQNSEFARAVESLSRLVETLADRRDDIGDSVATMNVAARSIADLITQARHPLKKVVTELDRTAVIVVTDHDYVDNLLNTLPDAYKVLGRQGLYGDFFTFYLCDLVLKVNGKGGQPVFITLAGQATGRCTPQ